MTRQPNLQITDAEWEVMQAVWNSGEQAAGDVIARVGQSRNWNHRTIRTLLARLVEKGAVEVRVDGNKHLYQAAVSKQACVGSAAKSFRERFFAGDLKSMLLHFVENEEISEAEFDELRKSLANRKREATKVKRSKRGTRRKNE